MGAVVQNAGAVVTNDWCISTNWQHILILTDNVACCMTTSKVQPILNHAASNVKLEKKKLF